MTVCDEFSEICITLNTKEYSEIFTSEVADFTNEAIEFAESGAIIIRTSKDMNFINALLAHLQGFCKDLSAINNQNITFSHTITKKQNRDWIEEYKRGIKALRCGRFYIYPPWEKPFYGNSSLGTPCGDFGNLGRFADSSPVSRPKFPKNSTTSTANTGIFDLDSANQAKIAESMLDSADSITSVESANKVQQTIEEIAVEVVGFLDDFGRKARLKSAQCPKSSKSTQDAPKTKLQNTINIMLEPSLAFGTGHHASTFMCIEAIQALDSQDSLKNKKLLDFGCGSGILALCAEKLGAKVSLCDIDELAIAESTKNFNNNNATISHIWQGGIDKCATGESPARHDIYDIIVANIIASVLIEQKDNIASSIKCGGIVVLSGILDIYKDEVLARFSDFVPLSICQSDEWICATLQKL